MNFVAERLREYGIPLFELQIVTNGYEKSDRFCEVIKKFYEIIKICQVNNNKISTYLQIGISCDRYHKELGYEPEEAVTFYKRELKGYAKVTRCYDGNMPSADGRGSSLPEAIKIKMESNNIPRKVEYLNKNNKPMCPYGRTYNIVHENQIYVVCDMSLDINGRILFYSDMQSDSVSNDRHSCISNVNNTKDILSDIELYNKGKICCLDRMILSNKERSSSKFQIKMMKEIMRQDSVLRKNGIENNAYDALVDIFADKHISDPEKYGNDKNKILDSSPLGSMLLTEDIINQYKKEIIEDDGVYTYGK